jgi:hypothetical protein
MNTTNTSTTPNPIELLTDPQRVTVTVSQAAAILGMAKSTAHKNYKRTGFLLNGDRVPVLVCGSRTIVAVAHLRQVLGIPEPGKPFIFAPDDVAAAIAARQLAQ